MSVATQQIFTFEHSFADELEGLYVPWEAAAAPAPLLLALNEDLATELGADPGMLAGPDGLATLAGHPTPPGSTPIAMAYSGHQFGGYSPRLGDGRALLLGEIRDVAGRRRDLHLKGSGRTPFARGGDGKAAVGPMLREHLIGEAMHGLGIPTSRSLAVVATGEEVARETILPGAILARVAASHIRVGTFQYAAAHPDPSLLGRLADHAIARHYPEAGEADDPYLSFFEAVVEAQASLIARWMLVGFVHGVMNTDNMAISGESLDYGPCAFMDAFDPTTVFSSIDHAGRYAYGNQPAAASWNLARFGETLLGLGGDEPEAAQALALEVLRSFPERFRDHWRRGMNAKLGLLDQREGDDELSDDLLALMHSQGTDFTGGLRTLSARIAEDSGPVPATFADPAALDAWVERWRSRLRDEGADPAGIAARMNRVNPAYVPRNHLVEEALSAATEGDLSSFERLLDVVRKPFDERPGLDGYASPPAPGSGPYRTYCGT